MSRAQAFKENIPRSLEQDSRHAFSGETIETAPLVVPGGRGVGTARAILLVARVREGGRWRAEGGTYTLSIPRDFMETFESELEVQIIISQQPDRVDEEHLPVVVLSDKSTLPGREILQERLFVIAAALVDISFASEDVEVHVRGEGNFRIEHFNFHVRCGVQVLGFVSRREQFLSLEALLLENFISLTFIKLNFGGLEIFQRLLVAPEIVVSEGSFQGLPEMR
jgi:hypothetical protein